MSFADIFTQQLQQKRQEQSVPFLPQHPSVKNSRFGNNFRVQPFINNGNSATNMSSNIDISNELLMNHLNNSGSGGGTGETTTAAIKQHHPHQSSSSSFTSSVYNDIIIYLQTLQDACRSCTTMTASIVIGVFVVSEVVDIIFCHIMEIHSHFLRFIVKCIILYCIYYYFQQKNKKHSPANHGVNQKCKCPH